MPLVLAKILASKYFRYTAMAAAALGCLTMLVRCHNSAIRAQGAEIVEARIEKKQLKTVEHQRAVTRATVKAITSTGLINQDILEYSERLKDELQTANEARDYCMRNSYPDRVQRVYEKIGQARAAR